MTPRRLEPRCAPPPQIKPTYYSMAHRAGPAKVGFFMRNWELHASNDSETWVVVRKHVDDQRYAPVCCRRSSDGGGGGCGGVGGGGSGVVVVGLGRPG